MSLKAGCGGADDRWVRAFSQDGREALRFLVCLWWLLAGSASAGGTVFTNFLTMDNHYAFDTNVEPALRRGGPESRPSERDPEGHWGKVTAGLQLGLRFKTNVFVVGEPIIGYAFIRNATTNVVSYIHYMEMQSPGCDYAVVGPDDRALPYRLRAPLWGHDVGRRVNPGQQARIWVRLDQAFDLSLPGTYHVTATGKYCSVTDKRMEPFHSAPATIEIVAKNKAKATQ